ncbi:aldehyde dehydrogenase family protein [Bordetella bronchiseptica]|uniref:aldehyde dehydrogenase family protein n=1 Tax=Bordetella bronchiseptica TaxID=518 RepID=UPI00045A6040|nr:aldehyde dehydrogenase family protein [Bordetella bronchiseptica]KAK67284.1 putative aldehyde dehydrogenase DhaS [Bordetella bronchiseptica MO211]
MQALTHPRPDMLARPVQRHYIDGQWRASSSGETVETFNPSTGELITCLARGRQEDVDQAVAAARRAFGGPWSRFTPAERQKLMIKLHDVVADRWDELALLETLDMGAPLARMKKMRERMLQTIMFFASQTMNCAGQTVPNSHPGKYTTMILKAPVGVVGGIIPWNGPLISQWWILGGALATGCTVVMKPAEDASLTVLKMAEILTEAGVPPGVINVVTGLGSEAGAALAAHPDVDRIAFTGSTVTGREIIKASAVNMKRLALELGGKSPDVIFADADLDAAVPGAAMGVFNNSGQTCYSGTRVFVERKIQAEFTERLAAFSKTLKVGDPLDPSVALGPIVSRRQLDRVLGYVAIGSEEGAELCSGGQRLQGALANGYFMEPTVFGNVNNNMRVAREEIFGPVISVIPFDTADEALRLANDTEYGLGGAVWTSSLKTATRFIHGIQAGQVWVNCYGLVDPAVGFGGYKQSGYGWKGGSQHVDGFLYQKAVTINEN